MDFESAQGLQQVSCRVLVNCAGPWARDLLAKVSPALPLPSIELVQGSHILLPPLLDQYFYLEAPEDKRAVFVLPWQGKLMVGTTEKIYKGLPEAAHCSDAERNYLLRTLMHYFPDLNVPADKVTTFAGLRVLPHTEQTAFARPREVLFEVDDHKRPRLLSVMGGKLTTYRATAQMALLRLRDSLPVKEARADTADLSLTPTSNEELQALVE